MADKNWFGFPDMLWDSQTEDLDALGLDIFRFQFDANSVYGEYCKYLGRTPDKVKSFSDIPFMPIEFFKNHKVVSGDWTPEVTFLSSGTTGMVQSKHYVRSLDDYHSVARKCFELTYGSPSDYVILALLPSYLDREGSSLISMVDMLIKESGDSDSGFFLNDIVELNEKYQLALDMGKKVMIWGVSFALLEAAERGFDWDKAIIIETGGMKGRRKEITRPELHNELRKGLNAPVIHSEYGMTELISQAYSTNKGLFKPAPWIKIKIFEVNDPLEEVESGQTGTIGIFDPSNLYSCSFIATQDLGKWHDNGFFEVTGRLDNSDIRGCNLMMI